MVLAFLLALQPTSIQRDGYGVPWITATSEGEAYFLFGKAVTEDRLWQMEMSRRLSRGRLAEVLGRSALASDQQIAKTGYSDDEILAQFKTLPTNVRAAFEEYARGVNETIAFRRDSGTLPEGYAHNGFDPEPWTPLDSCAIVIQLMRQFGRGGAGELRNYALYLYLKGQPCKDNIFDVMDDLAWQNDPASVPTLTKEDDWGAPTRAAFPTVTRKQTEAHFALLPATNVFELMPAIQLASAEETHLIAEHLSAPFKVGSYAIVVSPSRSQTGKALLLSGPQMGHTDPSVVYEVALQCPEFSVEGIGVPGVPIVAIGATPYFSWGLTSGVADIEDVYFSKRSGEDEYVYGKTKKTLIKIARPIQVKGAEPVIVEVVRTHYGPVILDSKVGDTVYSVRSSFWNRELSGVSALMDTYDAKSPNDLHKAISKVPVTFNYFYATVGGETGYRYAGLVPVRAKGYDPRFPLPSGPETEWQGFISAASMPHTKGVKSGLLVNWNNKASEDWPNMDTPVWGSPFRNEALIAALPTGKIGIEDMEKAVWTVARRESATMTRLMPFISGVIDTNGDTVLRSLVAYDGWEIEGSVGARVYNWTVRELRKELFKPAVGSFIQPEIFQLVVQPSVILKAFNGETKYDFLCGRSKKEVMEKSVAAATAGLMAQYGDDSSKWGFVPSTISVHGLDPIPYVNRGTYIQIFELLSPPVGRSVASPGAAESEPHSTDQANLVRTWTYKPMRPLPVASK